MRFMILGSLSLLLACQNTPCRELARQKAAAASANGTDAPKTANTEVLPAVGVSPLKVKIFKPDGSLQCGMGKKISLDVMEKELKGIQVFNKYNRNDGLMRIQVCGAPTGDSNVYEIKKDDLEKALKLGFKQWTAE